MASAVVPIPRGRLFAHNLLRECDQPAAKAATGFGLPLERLCGMAHWIRRSRFLGPCCPSWHPAASTVVFNLFIGWVFRLDMRPTIRGRHPLCSPCSSSFLSCRQNFSSREPRSLIFETVV